MTLEIKKIIKYPPEILMEAIPFNLVSGDNKVAYYIGFEPYALIFKGFSFLPTSGLRFYANVDGVSEIERMDDLASAKGLDYEEDIKFPSYRLSELRIFSPSAISGYPWRYKVMVIKPTTAFKLKTGMPLSAEDERLATKYDLRKRLSLWTPQQFDPFFGIEEWRTQTVSMTSSGTILRKIVPTGKKYILTNISVVRPSAPASAYINVIRDDVEKTLYLDTYCLQSLSYNAPIRIVALKSLDINLEVLAAGTYNVRVTYGIGDITLREKVMWGLPLDEEEMKIAESEDLFDKVAAGVV
ncbi:MAG: hypothetical protein QW253_00130 [Metallosphaera sp.]